MCLQLRDALRVGCIGLSDKFFCNTMEPKEMLATLDSELRNFCILIEAPKTPFGKGAALIVPCLLVKPAAADLPTHTYTSRPCSEENLQWQGGRAQR